MIEILILAMSISIAVISAIWSTLAIIKLLKLKKKFNDSVILIPLYKRSKWTHFTICFLGLAIIADIVFMIVLKSYLVCACILVILISLVALLIVMMSLKYAVVDEGLIIPYKIVIWEKFYDYKIYENKIIFCGDKNGFDTFTASSTPLIFDDRFKDKLIEILDKHKLNK